MRVPRMPVAPAASKTAFRLCDLASATNPSFRVSPRIRAADGGQIVRAERQHDCSLGRLEDQFCHGRESLERVKVRPADRRTGQRARCKWHEIGRIREVIWVVGAFRRAAKTEVSDEPFAASTRLRRCDAGECQLGPYARSSVSMSFLRSRFISQYLGTGRFAEPANQPNTQILRL